MEFPYIITVVLYGFLLHSTDAVYQAECDSLDDAVNNINQAQLNTWGGRMNCSKNVDCTGLKCMLTFQDQQTELTMKLHPCTDPPQMYLLIQNPSDTSLPYIEETITHGDVYTIPGLHYSYTPFLSVSVGLEVQFEKVTEGLQIGLSLKLFLGSVSAPGIQLLPPTVIQTPPCSTQPPGSLQCERMKDLVDSMSPPQDFQCERNEDCRGFHCSGTIHISAFSYPITANSVLDSCTQPISYNITLWNENGELIWSHSFTHSSVVPIEGNGIPLPKEVAVKMNVTMKPVTDDIDYLLTTIRLTVYMNDAVYADEVFLQNGRVPIPPCDHLITTPTPGPPVSLTPIPGAQDECSTFQAISADITNNEFFANDNMQCRANGPKNGLCDGFSCNMTTNGNNFVYKIQLFHCETPVRLLFTVDDLEADHDYHVTRNVSGHDTVDLDRISPGLKIKIFVNQLMNDVELALTLKVLINGELQPVALVQDRLVPVPPCSTIIPGPTDAANKPTAVNTKVTKPGSYGGNGGKNDQSSHTGSNQAATIAVPVVLTAVVVVVVVILAVFWYRRRSRGGNDQFALMDNASAPL